ncbi:class I SAM-dependent methyltransferase [Waterburya agarophytonicola K14]|uniref:Class I SAM-dependent methyltransferase n=1 Tax=Waterburya agarophytonicola KI4 TaxID=2874699 RepID=A0A964BUL5_9CYAN|nr:class I SAM-dependent methyltransferase [Waterburya agarophytonicola]MCC0178501.1 class I SAM-dependent methyltransferase [Waterburya agarophytonicola KI4]
MNNNNSLRCPICEARVFPKFTVPCDYRKPNNSQDYKIYWCSECDYGMTENRPSKEEVEDFYDLDDYYTHNAATSDVNENKISFLDRLRIHLSYLFDQGEDLDPGEVDTLLKTNKPRMCEIGCGNGKNLIKFQASGYDVFGIEPDPAARKMAQKITPNILSGTAEELPQGIKNEKYDIVLMSHVLEHCIDINKVMSNVKEILNDGGVYIVEIPNCNSLGFQTYRGEWPWSDIPRHLNFFTGSSLDKIFKKHGFETSFVKYQGFCRQFSNSWLKTENEIWTAFYQCDIKKEKKPNFKTRAWKLLLKSIFMPNSVKYDSVRLIGVK